MYHRIDEIVAAGYHLLNCNDKYAFCSTPPPNEKYILFQWTEDKIAVQGGKWIIACRW
jgi:hypothetical protein